MPPLMILEIWNSGMGNRSLVPDHDRALLPFQPATEVQAPDVIVQKR